MPPRPPVNSVCKLELLWDVGSKAAANVLYFSFSPFGPAALAYVTDLANNASDAMAALHAEYPDTTTFLGATATDLTSDTAFSFTAASTTPGSRDGLILPANVALLASYTVARRFRGGHPRSYIPWFTSPDVLTPQEFVVASVEAATTDWQSFLTACLASTGGGFSTSSQVLVSYIGSVPVPGTPRPVPLVNTIVFTECDQIIASQRRRDGRH